MKTKDLSEEQLLDYFKEHVRYEVQMLLNATHAIAEEFQITRGLEYMTLESYVIHLRNLINFLYPPGEVRDTDVCAKNFFIKKETWEEIRSDLSETLVRAKNRADKEVGHLTTFRLDANDENRPWDVKGLTCEVMPLFNFFCESADKVVPVSLMDNINKHYSVFVG